MSRAARMSALSCALLLGAAGCAVTGSYEPRPSPRITPLDVTGQRVFARDGQRYEVGFLGGGAQELVRGNDAARAEAASFRRDQVLAFTFLGVSLGAFAVAADLGLERDQRHPTLSANLFFAGFVSSLVSIAFSSAGTHALTNAINIFNDGLAP